MSIIINEIEYPSYATVEDADKYFGAKFGCRWNEISVEDKQKLLVTATREIDKFKYQGCKVDENQELKFPRCINGMEILVDYVFKICCSEVANAIYNIQITDGLTTPGAENIQSMSVGDTSITYKKNATIETDIFTATARPIVQKYLGEFLVGNIKVIL